MGTYTKALSYTVPAATAPGTYVVLAQLDSLAAVVESNKANNLFAPAPVVGVVRPDLSWNSLTTAAGTSGKISVTRSFQVSNVAITPNFTLDYRISLNAIYGDADDILLGSETISAAADKTVGAKSKTLSFTLPTLVAGQSYYLFANLDAGGVVVELNESNNLFTRFGTVPTFSTVVVPSQIAGGATPSSSGSQSGGAQSSLAWLNGSEPKTLVDVPVIA
ncbi:MAG: hypothetical protein NTW19_14335 [Planctomycetota bacterium]|nr:hypothetical protein [Planctomycetota bacterium]